MVVVAWKVIKTSFFGFLLLAGLLFGQSASAGGISEETMAAMTRNVVVNNLAKMLKTMDDHKNSRSTICLQLGKYLQDVSNLAAQSENYYNALTKDDDLEEQFPGLLQALRTMTNLAESYCFTDSRYRKLNDKLNEKMKGKEYEGRDFYVKAENLSDLRTRLLTLTHYQVLIAWLLMPDSKSELVRTLRGARLISSDEREAIEESIGKPEIKKWKRVTKLVADMDEDHVHGDEDDDDDK